MLLFKSESYPRSFRNLAPRTRLLVGLGIIAWGGIGLALSDTTEKKFGLEATEEDRVRLREGLPSLRAETETEYESKDGTRGKAG